MSGHIPFEPEWYVRATGSYTQTKGWRFVRTRVLEERGARCEACGLECFDAEYDAKPLFHVHHLTYERVGREKPGDLVVVCEPCHNAIHCLEPESRRSPEQHQAAAYGSSSTTGCAACCRGSSRSAAR